MARRFANHFTEDAIYYRHISMAHIAAGPISAHMMQDLFQSFIGDAAVIIAGRCSIRVFDASRICLVAVEFHFED